VTGQTYSRKVDSQVLGVLSGISQSAHKAAVDLRLLASRKELEEPFEEEQIGSSAMAYKRNPMRAERICGLARFVPGPAPAAAARPPWPRPPSPPAPRRGPPPPRPFPARDPPFFFYQNTVSGWVLYPPVIARNLAEELPFMATETILMAGVAAGGDRQ